MTRKAITLADLQAMGKDERVDPTPEQIARGMERRFVTHVESSTKAMAHVSAHSPVERWKAKGRLSDSQMAAIGLVRRLWDACGVKQKLTAAYGERLPPSADNEWLAVHEMQARRDLERIEGYFLPWQWDVFENVVRHDMSAGVAGEDLGFAPKASQAACLMLVYTVADTIAERERLT